MEQDTTRQIKIIVNTIIDEDKIIQIVYSDAGSIQQKMMTSVMDTKEKHIKDALISLGWRPPEE